MATVRAVERSLTTGHGSSASAASRATDGTAAKIGMWAAIALAVINVWFWVAFLLYEPTLQAPWRGMADFAARFSPSLYLAWAIPAFLFAPGFLIVIACIHAWAPEARRTSSLLALVFALPGATLMAGLYYIQMTVVPHNLGQGLTDGLRLWIYAPPYPFTFPGALEGVGYGFEAAAFLWAAQVFAGDRLQSWLRWTFRVTGLSAMLVFVDPVFRLPVPLVFADGALALVLLSAAPLLLARFWNRELRLPSYLQQGRDE
jgi:hypothetical protein